MRTSNIRLLSALSALLSLSSCYRFKECGTEYGDCPESYVCVGYSAGTPGRCELTSRDDVVVDADGGTTGSCTFVQALFGTEKNSFFGNAVASNGQSVLIGAVGGAAPIGRAYLYDGGGFSFAANSSFSQAVMVNASAVSGSFGRSVAMMGNQAIVSGVKGWSLYQDSGGGWTYRSTSSVAAGEAKALAFDGTYVAVGVLSTDNSVELRRLSDGMLCNTIRPSSGMPLSGFGEALAIANNTLLIGAYGGAGEGSVQSSALACPGDAANAQKILAMGGSTNFGKAIAASGAQLLVGAPAQAGNAPSFYTYVASGRTWPADLNGPSRDHGAAGAFEVGDALAIDSNLVVVGTPGLSGGAGGATIYRRAGDSWVLLSEITADFPGRSAADHLIDLGRSVAVSGSLVIIGAPSSEKSGTATGAALIYRCQ